MVLHWHGDKFNKELDKEMENRLERAAIIVKNEAKELVSNPSPPVSVPGDPPNKDTGRGRASISHEVDGKTARVGSNVDYMKFLEIGTSKMDARPWLSKALANKQREIERILGK